MNWVAIIGAAAWTPQIITWVHRALTQSKISLHLHLLPQIGYTTLGPIFNVTFALLSEKKDAILNKISSTLRHESGASYTFDWAGHSQTSLCNLLIQNRLYEPQPNLAVIVLVWYNSRMSNTRTIGYDKVQLVRSVFIKN